MFSKLYTMLVTLINEGSIMHKTLLFLLLGFTVLFSAQIATVTGLDPNGDGFLSLRAKPKGKEIGKLYNGNKVKILKKKGKYYKVKVVKSGMVGYAHGNWIKTGKSSSSKRLHVIRIPSNDTLSVRSNAGIHNKKIGDLAYNETGIKKLKCKNAPSGKRWCKVRHSSIPTGWVMAKYISSKSSSTRASSTGSNSSYNSYAAQRQRDYDRRKRESESRKRSFCFSLGETAREACLGNAYATNENARHVILGNCYAISGHDKDGMIAVCTQGKSGCYALKNSDTMSSCVSCDGNNRWLRMYAAGASTRCY